MKPEESDHYHSTICHPSAAAFMYYTYLKERSLNRLITTPEKVLLIWLVYCIDKGKTWEWQALIYTSEQR